MYLRNSNEVLIPKMRDSKFHPIKFEITGKQGLFNKHRQIDFLGNFTSEAGCIDICNQKYYFSGFPSVSDMHVLRELQVEKGNEHI